MNDDDMWHAGTHDGGGAMCGIVDPKNITSMANFLLLAHAPFSCRKCLAKLATPNVSSDLYLRGKKLR